MVAYSYQYVIMIRYAARSIPRCPARPRRDSALVVDPETKHWVRFVVTRVESTVEKPHGLGYSPTLHGPDGERLVGFDNAHPIRPRSGPGGKPRGPRDHKHRLKTVKPYDYQDAATLLGDFWEEVYAVLKEKGVGQ
jgi:hypothetical protein